MPADPSVTPPGGPPPIQDVNIRTFDEAALADFTNAVRAANEGLVQAQTGMRQSRPTVGEVSATGTSASASVATAAVSTNMSGPGGQSSPQGLDDHAQDSTSDPTQSPSRVRTTLHSMATRTPTVLPGADDPTRVQQFAAAAGKLPLVSPLATTAYKMSGNVSEGLSFALANHVLPAISASNAATLGMATLNPYTAQAMGTSSGLPASSTALNIPLGPLGNFGVQVPFGGTAYSATMANTFQALSQGFGTAGLSSSDITNTQGILAAGGFPTNSGGLGGFVIPPTSGMATPTGPGTTAMDADALAKVLNAFQTKGGPNYVPGLDPQFAGEQAMNFVRNGQASIRQVIDAFSGLDASARKAGLSVNDMAQQVASAGEQLQAMGPVTSVQGFTAARTFSDVTGMAPSLMPQLMQNGIIQGQMIAATGLPPTMLPGAAASNPSLVPQATESAINMMNQAFKGQFQPLQQHFGGPNGFTLTQSAQDQTDEMAAAALNMPLDQYKRMKSNQKQVALQGSISSALQGMTQRLSQIQQQPGQDTGAVNALFSTKAGPGVNLSDVLHYARQPASGVSPADVRNIQSEDAKPAQKIRDLQQLLRDSRNARVAPNSTNKVYVGFTGLADKVLRQVMSGSSNPVADANAKTARQGGSPNVGDFLKDRAVDAGKYLENLTPVPNVEHAPGEIADAANTVGNAASDAWNAIP
jgi:hypothetical protein